MAGWATDSTSSATWGYWASSSTTTTASATVWGNWNSSTSTATTSAWYDWNDAQATAYQQQRLQYDRSQLAQEQAMAHEQQQMQTTWYQWSADSGGTLYIQEKPLTKAERRRRKHEEEREHKRLIKEERRHKAAAELKRRKKEAAEEQAIELLQDLIGPEQRKVYEETGRLLVHGKKYDWMIQKQSTSVTLQRVEKGKVVDLCVHLQGQGYPLTDHVIDFALRAKGNEDGLKKTANDQGSREVIELPRCAAM